MIALIGTSDLDYVVTFFALSRLGYAAMLLSPYLALDAHVHLLQETRSEWIIYSSHLRKAAEGIQLRWNGKCMTVPKRHEYDIPSPGPRIARDVYKQQRHHAKLVFCTLPAPPVDRGQLTSHTGDSWRYVFQRRNIERSCRFRCTIPTDSASCSKNCISVARCMSSIRICRRHVGIS